MLDKINSEVHLPSQMGVGEVIYLYCNLHFINHFRLGEACSHVGGLLFKLEMAIRLGIRDRACTGEACRWNQVNWNGVPAARLSQIMLYSDEAKSKLTKGVRRRAPPAQPTEQQKQSFLLNLLRCNSDLPVGLSLFNCAAINFVIKREAPGANKLPPCLGEWQNKAPDDPIRVVHAVTPSQLNYLEEMTRNQTQSLLWHEMRVGRINSSQVHQVLHTNQTHHSPSLLKRLSSCNPKPVNTAPILWGRNHEDEALQEYADFMSDHIDFELFKSGLRLKS